MTRVRRTARGAARVALFVGVLRLLAVVSAFQLTGTGHLASDFLQVITVGHTSDENAEHENERDHDCPPGCPTCHHVHYSGASLPAPPFVVTRLTVSAGATVDWSRSEDAPPGPPHASVYRPPRA